VTKRTLVHGLPYFGKMFAELMDGDGWSFRYYPDSGTKNLTAMAQNLRECDLVYQIGGRVTIGKFLLATRWLGKKKVVVHWVGSDTVDEQKAVSEGRAADWVTQELHHWAESDWMVREVQNLGISCELVPLPSARVPEGPSPFPADFTVLVYMPDVTRAWLYGLDMMLETARALPHIPFELVGLTKGTIQDAPANLRVHGRIPDLTEFYRRATVVWRPVRHDGLSFMVLEALGHGRHVLWSYEFPGCVRVASAGEAQEQISRLHDLHTKAQLGVNTAGVDAIAERYLPQRLKKEILSRLEKILES
jgi:hypothetical protein